MSDPEIDGRAPIADQVEAGKICWWCAYGRLVGPAAI